ncbi:hypothetical protein KR038_002682, partial [Drosophila bunnanda]
SPLAGIPDFLNITTEPFVKIGNGYYFFESNITKNWYDAYQSCRNMGAGLIDFESIEEWNLINNYLNDTGIYKKYWTSGTILADKSDIKKRTWFSTGKPMSLDIWYPGEPNNLGGNELCDEMGKYQVPKIWGLNDANCNLRTCFICKASKPATASFLVW